MSNALVQKEQTEKSLQFPEQMSPCPHDLKSIKPVAKIGLYHATNHKLARRSWDEMSIIVVPD